MLKGPHIYNLSFKRKFDTWPLAKSILNRITKGIQNLHTNGFGGGEGGEGVSLRKQFKN